MEPKLSDTGSRKRLRCDHLTRPGGSHELVGVNPAAMRGDVRRIELLISDPGPGQFSMISEQAIKSSLHDVVAIAGGRLQSVTIQHGHVSAPISDHARPL